MRTILFSPTAYLKQLSLIKWHKTEVAWMGTVEKTDEETYYIKDIYMYPQKVTGATVNADAEDIMNWADTLDDEIYNALRFQGHSHVFMGVSPSATDMSHQKLMAKNLKEDDYYLFLIINKKGQMNYFIYEGTGEIFTHEDIEWDILYPDGTTHKEFVFASDDMII